MIFNQNEQEVRECSVSCDTENDKSAEVEIADKLKKRVDNLFAKLDGAYPDKIIISLQKDHKKWDESARELSKLLGYASKNEFLIENGYTIHRAESGRPKTTDHIEVIEELWRRYPNGSDYTKLGELVEANPDLGSKLKTISNTAVKLFGVSMKDHFVSIGLLSKKISEKKEVTKKGISDTPVEEKVDLEQKEAAGRFAYALEEWERKCQEITLDREELFDKRLAEEREILELSVKNEFEGEIQKSNSKKAMLEKRKSEVEAQLGKAGVFDFMKKKTLKKELEKLVSEISAVDNRIKKDKQGMKAALGVIPEKLSAAEIKIKEEIEKELPFPAKPEN